METLGNDLSLLLLVAWLLPLFGFVIEVFGGYWSTRLSKAAAYLAVGCIGGGFVCSVIAFSMWGGATHWAALEDHAGAHGSSGVAGEVHAADDAKDDAGHASDAGKHGDKKHAAGHATAEHHGEEHHTADAHHDNDAHHEPVKTTFSGTFYSLATFGDLELSIDYYIDSLTLVMFLMVTLIATCIHVFAIGYMSDELTEDYVDHQVHTSDGGHFHRPGRFYRFFSYMSLFCFSMLGLVLAGNIFQVFVFWELVGICSYLLIGFYVERKSASNAANKAFIVNRVGDFGFIIGLMIIWTSFGTFRFGALDSEPNDPGLFQMVRDADGQLDLSDDGKTVYLRDTLAEVHDHPQVRAAEQTAPTRTISYLLLVAAGLGIFGGCVGKSAQFPLQTWLPDAMEGPTPVSALVHSATMVAAGVYLAGRFYPMFTPEVLLVIAYIGCITLFVAATIAIVATDIKRVLAYSTISQLGYMMLAIGVAGWAAGLFHLITHAFFKSLMFLCSGSVIVGCHHEQEMPKMGGLWRKMPITAFTMLVGVIAISGLAIPGIIAFSGYHSKDAIVATALAYTQLNSGHFLLFLVPLITAGLTAFYMFRLWFYTFAGKPRDQELHDHVRETPLVMTGPLLLLSIFAAFCAVGGEQGSLYKLLSHSEPVGVAHGIAAVGTSTIALPGHELIHSVHGTAGMYALLVAFLGTLIAFILYGTRLVDPGEIKRQFSGLHTFLVEKWRFDEVYDVMFVKPVHVVAGWCAAIDTQIFDRFLHGCSKVTIDVSRWDRRFDEGVIDGLVNLLGSVTFAFGRSLRVIQTGQLRQYVMFIAVGVVTLFMLLFMFFPK